MDINTFRSEMKAISEAKQAAFSELRQAIESLRVPLSKFDELDRRLLSADANRPFSVESLTEVLSRSVDDFGYRTHQFVETMSEDLLCSEKEFEIEKEMISRI